MLYVTAGATNSLARQVSALSSMVAEPFSMGVRVSPESTTINIQLAISVRTSLRNLNGHIGHHVSSTRGLGSRTPVVKLLTTLSTVRRARYW